MPKPKKQTAAQAAAVAALAQAVNNQAASNNNAAAFAQVQGAPTQAASPVAAHTTAVQATPNTALQANEAKLHEYAKTGNLSALKALLTENPSLNKDAANKLGATALMFAAAKGHLDVVKLLVENGCNKDATKTDGKTALMSAAQFGRIEVVRYLVKKGCNKDAKKLDGWTALLWAARNSHLEVVNFLVEAGCNKNAKDTNGWTALILATHYGDYFDVVKFLVEKGAKASIKITEKGSFQGKKASDLARTDEIKNLLLAKEKEEEQAARNNNVNANNNNAAPPPPQAGLSNEARLAEKQAALAALQASHPGLVAEIFGIKQKIRNELAAALADLDKELEAAPRNGVTQVSGGALGALYAAAKVKEELQNPRVTSIASGDNNKDDDDDEVVVVGAKRSVAEDARSAKRPKQQS